MNVASRSVLRVIHAGFGLVGVANPTLELRTAAYLVVTAGLIPWAAMGLLGRGRPADIGIRRPNVFGWRWILVGYVVALPFMVWMTEGSGFAGPYLRQFRRSGAAMFLLSYLVIMVVEHLLVHGVLLALFRPDRRWPAPPPTTQVGLGGHKRMLQWLGLAQPITSGGADSRRTDRWVRWFGLPEDCVIPIVASAVVFGLVHLGKDTRELMLSIPGGVAQAYLAYRTNSWFTPFALHVATAATALAIILVRQPL